MNTDKEEVETSYLSANGIRYASAEEKQQAFYNELKALLKKYDAELATETTSEGYGWSSHFYEEIVINFGYDKNSSEEKSLGWIPQLNLGSGL